MSKDPIGLAIPDVSVFARRLAPQLSDRDGAPSHLSLLNMLARAAGFRNYQHMRASRSAEARLAAPLATGDIDFKLVERALTQFDEGGQMIRWPSRRPVQALCLWVMWAALPADEHLHERQVNAVLNAAHTFGDAALLRRSLVGMGVVRRNKDGSDYQRVEQRPPDAALEVIARISQRRSGQVAGSAGQ